MAESTPSSAFTERSRGAVMDAGNRRQFLQVNSTIAGIFFGNTKDF